MPDKLAKKMSVILPAALAAVLCCAMLHWNFGFVPPLQEERISGADGTPAKTGAAVPPSQSSQSGDDASAASNSGRKTDAILTTPEGARLEKGAGVPGRSVESWPCFRGSARDAVRRNTVELARTWPEDGPPVVWELDLGQGYAGAAVRDGRVYIFDYDDEEKRDLIRCVSSDDGADIWRYSYPAEIKRNHGVSRTVVALDGPLLFGFSPKCQVTCLDAETGVFKWRMDLVEQFGASVPNWYAGQCPLVEDGRLILAVGSPEILVMAVDCSSGAAEWRSPNPHESKMTHSSIVPMEYKGRRIYACCGTKGAVGVSAADGGIVWQTDEFKWHTIAPSPVQLPGDRILFTAGYGCSSKLVRLLESDGRVLVEAIRTMKPKEFAVEQHTPVIYDGFIYAVLPKPRLELVCMDLEFNEIWASGSQNKFGIGPWMIADGIIYVMDDDGVLSAVEASPGGFTPLARSKVLPGPDSWGPMAMVDGRLYVRDLGKMKCLDVSKTR